MHTLKKLGLLLLAAALTCCLFITNASAADSSITLDNAGAAVTGTGFADEQEVSTLYDTASGYVVNVGTGSVVTYTVGGNVSGSFDVYLEVSRAATGFGTTPFSMSLNGGPAAVPIIKYGFCQDPDLADLYDKGTFLCLKNAALKTGDTVTVTALPGFVFGTSSFLPAVGDIRLYKPGTKVAVGYDGALQAASAKKPADPLSGLKLIWLGSSVTYGQAAQGYSMADYLEETHPALQSYKYAISGTTLVDDSATSYISRMKQIPADIRPDAFIVQLSTNDAALGKPFGVIKDGKNPEDFDTKTIYGAIEYVIAYAAKTWNCPVIFYTGTYYDGDTYNNDGTAYAQMVTALLEVQKKWGINVVDLYGDTAMTALYNTDQWKQYMSDGVHPKADGYRLWWGPKFEQALTTYLTAGNTAPATNGSGSIPASDAGGLDNLPKTGDAGVTVWWGLLIFSALLLAGISIYQRRNLHTPK